MKTSSVPWYGSVGTITVIGLTDLVQGTHVRFCTITFQMKTIGWIWSNMGTWGEKRERRFTSYSTVIVLEEDFSKSILTFWVDNSCESFHVNAQHS